MALQREAVEETEKPRDPGDHRKRSGQPSDVSGDQLDSIFIGTRAHVSKATTNRVVKERQ